MKKYKCSTCNNLLDEDKFWKRPWGVNSWCKDCCREYYRKNHLPRTWWGDRLRDERTEIDYSIRRKRCEEDKRLSKEKKRVCSCCMKVKSLDKFHKNQYTCKECRKLE